MVAGGTASGEDNISYSSSWILGWEWLCFNDDKMTKILINRQLWLILWWL